MRLSQGIYGFLARSYGRILRKCAILNMGLLLGGALFAPCSQAAALQMDTSTLTINSSQVIDKIVVKSGTPPPYTVNITRGTTRLPGSADGATGKAQPMIVNTAGKALTADINVIGADLHFGTGTAAPGGTLQGQITLNNGNLLVRGTGNSYYTLNKGESTGSILVAPGSGGDLEVVRRGNFNVRGNVGTAASPLANVIVSGEMFGDAAANSMLGAENLYANAAILDTAAFVTVQREIEARNAILNNTTRLYSPYGDIKVGNVQSTSSSSQAFNWNTIEAERGSIHIGGIVNGEETAGEVKITQGLLNIIAGQDIVFAKPDIIANHGAGALFLKAGGSLSAANDSGVPFDVGDASISALTMRVKGSISAGNLDVSEVSASDINIINDASIHGGSTVIANAPTTYGSFSLTGNGQSHIGGNLDLFNVNVQTGQATVDVGGSAAINRASGSFNSLSVGESLTFNGGDLTGDVIKAASIELGGGLYATNLTLDTVSFGDHLLAGQGTTLKVGSIDTSGGAIEAHGGSIASGNAGSADNPLGGITLTEGSTFTSKSGIWTSNLSLDSATLTAENGDISATGEEIAVTSATLTAPNLTLGNQRSSGNFNNAQLLGQESVTFAGNMLFAGDSVVHSGGDIIAAGSISDQGSLSLELAAGGDIRGSATIEAGNILGRAVQAGAIAAKSLLAETLDISGNVAISGGSLLLDGSGGSTIGGDLTLDGGSARAANTSSFGSLNVGGAVNVANADLVGVTLKAGSLNVAGGAATTVSIKDLDGDTGVNIGPNAFVTFGSTDSSWLGNAVSGLGANSGAVGLYSRITLGEGASFRMSGDSGARSRAAGDLSFASGSMLLVPGEKAYEGVNPKGMISANAPKTASVENGARVQINGVAANKVYVVLGENITTQYAGSEAWEGSNLGTDSHVLRLEKLAGRDGSFVAKAIRPYPGLDSGLGDIIGGDTYPTTPIVPATPNKPTTPDTPSNPDTNTPSNPGTSTPTVPTTPVTPANPSNPGTNTPSNPGTSAPTVPTTPITPANPSNPGTDTPSVPDNPGDPGTDTPATPANPTNPGTNTPTTPDNPSDPGVDTPATPDNPATPGTDAPAEPANPADEAPAAPVDQGPVMEIGTEDQHLNSPWGGVKFLSRVTSTRYMDHDYDLAVKTLESAARMVVLGGAPQMTAAANAAASDGAAMRASFSSGSGLQEAVYDLEGRNIALWIMPMFKNVAGYNLTANNFGYDFYGGLGGVALGADWTWLAGKDLLRFGLDFNIGGGYAESGGDLARTTNSMGFWGAGIYGAWLHGNFGLAADAQFTASWNSLKQDLPRRLEMADLEGDVTASAISAGLRAEYRIPLGNWELAPHAGFRYMYLTTDNYTFYSDGAVMDGEAVHQNIWTFPVGLSLAGIYETDSGWQIRPKLDVSAIPAAGDMNARTNIQFTGTSRNATLETQIMDYFSGQASLGVEFSKNDFSLGVAYTVQAGMKTVSQSVFGSLRYEF